MTNLSLCLTESAARYPDAAVFRCDGVTTTYSMLAAMSPASPTISSTAAWNPVITSA